MKPVVFLDVDGTLLTYVDPANDFSDPRVQWTVHPEHGYRYNPKVVDWVWELSRWAEVRWCTAMGERAATVMAPALGLPEFPVLDRMDRRPGDFKINAVLDQLRQSRRPVLFIDDDIPHGPVYDEILAEAAAAGTQVFLIRPTLEDGLTEAHMLRIRSFMAKASVYTAALPVQALQGQ